MGYHGYITGYYGLVFLYYGIGGLVRGRLGRDCMDWGFVCLGSRIAPRIIFP